jgi:hypothetical protein
MAIWHPEYMIPHAGYRNSLLGFSTRLRTEYCLPLYTFLILRRGNESAFSVNHECLGSCVHEHPLHQSVLHDFNLSKPTWFYPQWVFQPAARYALKATGEQVP